MPTITIKIDCESSEIKVQEVESRMQSALNDIKLGEFTIFSTCFSNENEMDIDKYMDKFTVFSS